MRLWSDWDMAFYSGWAFVTGVVVGILLYQFLGGRYAG